MEKVLQALVQSPRLYLYFEELKEFISEEKKKRREFYEKISEHGKVEFINGEIIVQSPAKLRHIVVSDLLFQLIDTFVRVHHLGWAGHEKVMISLSRNDYEPDICFFHKSKSDRFTPEQAKFPAPDFIVEVLSPATEQNDRVIKWEDYKAHGISEYWVIDPETEVVEQYFLEHDDYKLILKSNSGMVKSLAISGFAIPIKAIFDAGENLKELQRILASLL